MVSRQPQRNFTNRRSSMTPHSARRIFIKPAGTCGRWTSSNCCWDYLWWSLRRYSLTACSIPTPTIISTTPIFPRILKTPLTDVSTNAWRACKFSPLMTMKPAWATWSEWSRPNLIGIDTRKCSIVCSPSTMPKAKVWSYSTLRSHLMRTIFLEFVSPKAVLPYWRMASWSPVISPPSNANSSSSTAPSPSWWMIWRM